MLEDVYALSPLQQGLYYHWLRSPESPVYFEQVSYSIRGRLNIALLEKAYQLLVARHAALRTFFTLEFGEAPLQVVRRQADAEFTFKDVSENAQSLIEEFKQADRDRGFDLHKGSQMRLAVLAQGNDKYEFIWSFHHIIMDGWCAGILMKDFCLIYQSLMQGAPLQLGKVYPYSSYIAWLETIDKEESLNYWRNHLAGYDSLSSLPQKKARIKSFDPGASNCTVPPGMRQAIRTLCIEMGITESTFFQAIWGILLCRYNQVQDAVFGAVVSGRPAGLRGAEEMIGLFINTIPVRIRAGKETSVGDLLKQVQQDSIDGTPHHYIQLAEVQSASSLGRELFNHIMVFENFLLQDMADASLADTPPEEELSILSARLVEQSNYDLVFTIIPGNNISLAFDYNRNVYDSEHIKLLQQHFFCLLEQALKDPSASVDTLGYVDMQEQSRLLHFNVPELSYPANTTVLHLFGQQVALAPEQTAVVFQEASMTYRELDEQSNRLANYLIEEYNIRPGDHVALMAERSEKLIIALLAVLKAGAAYVPVDPVYPEARRQYILDNARTRLLITESAFLLHLSQSSLPLFALDIQLDGLDTSISAPALSPEPQHLAYVIYTSGSTGTPKGCAITHDNLFHYIYWANRNYFNTAQGNFALFTSLSFDLTVTSIFCSLTRGKRLHVYGQHQELSEVLAHSFSPESGIDSIKLTPSHINMLRHLELSSSTISCAIVGGEELTTAHVEVLKAINPQIEIYNEYGPTEATVGCVVYRAEAGEPVLIGKPMDHASIYVLDMERRLCGIGVAGEICIGGKGVSAGYINQPELTGQKFIANPFRAGEKMYCSGDMGRWRSDGQLEFLGRKDEQLKIRGYRIEPGDIEAALQRCDGVEAAVVMSRSSAGAEPELVAYVAGREGLSSLELRNQLARKLPAYMIPAHFVQLETLPLTENGKIDRRMLSGMGSAGRLKGVPYLAPGNEVEEQLVRIWQEVLGKEDIGVQDNFFDAGGDSIKIVRLSSIATKTLNRDISVPLLFQRSTIKELADYILEQPVVYEQQQFEHEELMNDLDKFN